MWDALIEQFREWLANWWFTIGMVLVFVVVVCGIVWWWMGPVYDPSLMTVTDIAINGVPVTDTLPQSVVNRAFTLTCTIRSNGTRFLSVNSHGDPYTGFILNEALCKRAFDEN